MGKSPLYIGRKVKKIRELRGLKQEALASLMGISPQTMSRIEQSTELHDLALCKIAHTLGVTVDAIKNFREEAVINIFQVYHVMMQDL
jgi:transcriptional regulator with XRE-family HTH domain